MLAWFQKHEPLIYSLGALSVGMLLILPIAMILVLVLLPTDYFSENKHGAIPYRGAFHVQSPGPDKGLGGVEERGQFKLVNPVNQPERQG